MKTTGWFQATALSLLAIFSAITVISVSPAYAYDFGDFKSSTLAQKAWASLAEGDVEGVLTYTNKVIELYGVKAKEMQAGLKDYVKGKNEDIFAMWALNDVATCLFIQGEVYRRANMKAEAVKVFQTLVNEYSFGQTWDVNGWFWKPAQAAKEKLALIDSGLALDFGDYSSSFMATQAWKALDGEDPTIAVIYADKVMEMYGTKAKDMQASLTEYPWQSREVVFNYWALNDVGTTLFIKGKALKKVGRALEAKAAFKTLVDEYFYAQCWDPQGWFWKPSEAAQQELDELASM